MRWTYFSTQGHGIEFLSTTYLPKNEKMLSLLYMRQEVRLVQDKKQRTTDFAVFSLFDIFHSSMGPTFFEKIFFLDQIMMIWSIQTLKNVPKHFQTRGFHHTPSRKKSETGQNLLIFGKSSNLYRDLA